MSLPREVVPGRFHFLTRRCISRLFLLRPGTKSAEIFAYVLAEAAAKYGIQIICLMTMSNHYHAVVYDPFGMIHKFIARFHAHAARALNRHWGRSDKFWSGSNAGVARLVQPKDVLAMTIYALANPVAAGLVERAMEWPGLHTASMIGGGERVVKRARPFFRKDGEMPEQAVFRTCTPPGWDREEWIRLVKAGVLAEEEKAAKERARTGKRVLGSKEVRRQSPFASPSTPEVRGKLNPAIICKDKWTRIAALKALKAFRMAYAAAWKAYKSGQRDVVFPYGTLMMAERHGVTVATP